MVNHADRHCEEQRDAAIQSSDTGAECGWLRIATLDRFAQLAMTIIFTAAMFFVPAAHAEENAKPQRIVSLNQCTDELVLRLADPQNIASVTWLSQDPDNANMAGAARKIPANHGTAEEAMAYRPDLVLVGAFTDPETRALLKRIGAPLARFDPPETLADVRRQILAFAARIGESERGEALVAQMDRDLERVSVDARRPKLKAIILRPNGFTVGAGSLVDEILAHAGLENLAAKLDIGSYEQVSLERVAMLDANVLIANSEVVGAPSLATDGLNHPVVKALVHKMRVVALPARLWTCPGPGLVEAVRRLTEATRDLRSATGAP
jgi:iron complex transport system substrate-binding protein